jgi:hypothetical protein
MQSNKKLVSEILDFSFTLNGVNRATVTIVGNVPTTGWTEPVLDNDRVGDGILHMDFRATPPEQGGTVVTEITTKRTFFLGGEPQELTAHSETNEMSLRLPEMEQGP